MTDTAASSPDVPDTAMSLEAFLQWAQGREGRWEYVDGRPINIRAMAGATGQHDDIVVNIISALRARVRGGPCRPQTADQAVRIPKGRFRRPDVLVDCQRTDRQALDAKQPTVVLEVQSPSTTAIDYAIKLEDYKTVETLRDIVYVDPHAPRVVHWTRPDVDGPWIATEVKGLDQTLTLVGAGVDLPLAEVFEDVAFEAG